MSIPSRRWPLVWPAVGIATYLLAPAAPQSLFGSWPLTPAGAAALAVAVAVAVFARRLSATTAARYGWVAFFVAAIALRVLFAGVAGEAGWLARYYANDSWSGAPEWSSEFRLTGATRVDRSLSFSGSGFPTYYLNGAAFTEGAQREVSEPMTVEWQGAFELNAPATVAIDVRAIGAVSVVVNGAEVLSTTGSGQSEPELAAGQHSATVRYSKPAGLEGALTVSLRQLPAGDAIAVFTPESGARASRAVDALAIGLDGLVAVLLTVILVQALGAAWQSPHRAAAVAGVVALGGLGVQGFLVARPFADRFHTLTGGDDWLGFESRARDVLQHGPLMTLGKPLGEGAAYFYHPFYSYFLAGVHALTGESLFGPIFVQFLILAVTALLMWSLTRSLFGTVPAWWALAALLALFEMDFIRYYTITLLSENLYVLTVTLCLVAFAKWAGTQSTTALIQAGLWAGISAATRPAMMMFLFPALAVTGAIAYRQRRGWWPLQAATLAGAAWMAVVIPFTIRNWVVARKLVLISDALGGTFIVHNVPAAVDPAPYMSGYTGGIVNGLAVLWRLAVEHPAAVLALQIKKLGFTLGMIHWFDGYRPHPELVAISLLYLAMMALSPVMRRVELWPAHAFVASHVASMFLTSPWNYGYRLILPPFVYTTALSVAAASALLWSGRAMRTTRS